MGKFNDLTGKRFGLLIVIGIAENRSGKYHWHCLCDCGNKLTCVMGNLVSGNTKSCGCLRHSMTVARMQTHKMTDTRFYVIYSTIRQRCTRESYSKYKNYGGRGIKCLWESFEEFRDDMYESYLEHVKKHGEKDTTIERIDNNGDYCKENCRWATYKEQARNKRTTVLFSLNGEEKTIVEWCEIYSIPRYVVYQRIKRLHWPLEESLTKQVRKLRKHE